VTAEPSLFTSSKVLVHLYELFKGKYKLDRLGIAFEVLDSSPLKVS
jgi:hypothetical protein